jgi:hypothetical protein
MLGGNMLSGKHAYDDDETTVTENSDAVASESITTPLQGLAKTGALSIPFHPFQSTAEENFLEHAVNSQFLLVDFWSEKEKE